VWALHRRLRASESVTHHALFRQETRWPGYYGRGDFMKLGDKDCGTASPVAVRAQHRQVGD